MSDVQVEETGMLLQVRLGQPSAAVDLQLVESLAEHLRAAFRGIAVEETVQAKVRVQLLVRDVRKGSLYLAVEPSFVGTPCPDPATVSRTLIADMSSLETESARATIGSNLLGHYKALIDVGLRAGGLELTYGGSSVTVSEERRVAFEAALREQPEAGSCVVGWIEAVNIHRRPWTFGLYTKLDKQRVECRFTEEHLQIILDLMERKVLVEIVGEGRFAPVGLTPRQLDVEAPPRGLSFDAQELLTYRRSAEILKPGETAADYLARIRAEAEVDA